MNPPDLPQGNLTEQAIARARQEFEIAQAQEADLQETALMRYDRILNECAAQFTSRPEDVPDPEMLLQNIRKVRSDARDMYLMLNLIYSEALEEGVRVIKPDTWHRLCKLLGKVS
jgi:hypothetical protein